MGTFGKPKEERFISDYFDEIGIPSRSTRIPESESGQQSEHDIGLLRQKAVDLRSEINRIELKASKKPTAKMIFEVLLVFLAISLPFLRDIIRNGIPTIGVLHIASASIAVIFLIVSFSIAVYLFQDDENFGQKMALARGEAKNEIEYIDNLRNDVERIPDFYGKHIDFNHRMATVSWILLILGIVLGVSELLILQM